MHKRLAFGWLLALSLGLLLSISACQSRVKESSEDEGNSRSETGEPGVLRSYVAKPLDRAQDTRNQVEEHYRQMDLDEEPTTKRR